MATALRLQAAQLSTVVLEAHGHIGGCAGYFRRQGFTFDVGATTLVEFEPGGVGAELLDSVGMPPVEGEPLPGYLAWLPDRVVALHRDQAAWHRERLGMLGDTAAHRSLWELLDRLAGVFWAASRAGIRLPVRSASDVLHDLRAVGVRHLPLARYLRWTLGDALEHFGLRRQPSLAGLLGMLVEDTVHSSVDQAPLINAALGVTIRGAGLTRHRGGMRGLWRRLAAHYRWLGGELRCGCRVERVTGRPGCYLVHTALGSVVASQVVSALPAASTARIAQSTLVAARLRPYLLRDEARLGGAVVAFLGVPDDEVAGQVFTHHQLMQDYRRPFGDGNNMFVSVSAAGDLDSSPPGHRAVVLSTHTELARWQGLAEPEYQAQKQDIGERLVSNARRAYPRLGERASFRCVGTPRTYRAYTSRPGGAVGGVRQTLHNTNQHAVPHNLGVAGFWLVGDSTWPGLGTVACVLGSRIVADGVRDQARHRARVRGGPPGAPARRSRA
jgi:phytoene dehydrogenase-like protein